MDVWRGYQCDAARCLCNRGNRRKQALVVDDSAAQRLVLAKNLENWGYQVAQAASGDAALQLCETTRFDLILSDWMMPGMNGLDFCRAFRALGQDTIPISSC